MLSVIVMLQPFDYNPSDHKRHKFMVQTMIVPNDSQDIESLVRALSCCEKCDSLSNNE